MKKIYLSISALAFATSIFAQDNTANKIIKPVAVIDTAKAKAAAIVDTIKKVTMPAVVATPATSNVDTNAVKFSKNITAQDLSTYLHRLASDEFEGRETGQIGQQKAGKYIAEQFASMGIPQLKTGGYFQQIPLSLSKAGKSTVTVNDKIFTFIKDFYYFSNAPETQLNLTAVTFLGYGIKDSVYNDYKNVDVKNKAIMILANDPMDEKGNSLITKKKDLSNWAGNLRLKMATAKDASPSLVLIVVDSVSADVEKMNHFITGSSLKLVNAETKMPTAPTVFISKEMANAILGKNNIKSLEKKITKSGKPYTTSINTKLQIDIKHDKQALMAQNVLGYIEGTDLKNELVVVTGHYDHLGKDGNVIFYGADDDGSGTSAVMEMAKTFAAAKRAGKGPRRSMLFMTVSGEEKGLLGSEYYSEHPVFPLENTVADLNIDMIGRLDEKHKDNPNYVYVIGSDKLSTQLHAISENANKTYSKLELDYTFNDPKDPNRFYFRSDHYNFAKHNIPVIFYFNGVHADYHKSTDTVEKIDFFKMEKITRLVFFTAWDLANRNERIKVDVVNAFGNK